MATAEKSRNKCMHHGTVPSKVLAPGMCHAGLCAMLGRSHLTSVLSCVGAAGWVVLPQPLHHILDPPNLLLDLSVQHFIL